MPQPVKIAAVLMASGYAKRFGCNKLLAQFQGRPLIETVLDSLPAEQFLKITVVTRYPEIAAYAAQRHFSVIKNTSSDDDTAQTIRMGIEAAPEAEGYMFFVCDQPLLRTQTIRFLCSAFTETPEQIIVPFCQGQQRNPVIFPKALRDALAGLPPHHGGKHVIKKNPHLLRKIPCGEPWEFIDTDSPGILEEINRFAALHPSV